MSETMSSRERMLAALRRRPHDHVPFSSYISQGPWYKEPLYWRDQFERALRLREMDLDPIIDIWLPDVRPHPDVEIKTWREKKGDETRITKEFHTPAGVLRQVVRKTGDWCGPRHGPWIPTTFGIEKRDGFGLHLFEHLGATKTLWGGVNAEVTLNSCDVERIEREVQDAIERLGANHGLILSTFYFPEIPQQGFMQMIEAWKKHRHYWSR